jgi:hypothetical protein
MVDYSPNAGLQNHWIVLTAKQDGDYLIQDPWKHPAETGAITLTGRFGFGKLKPAQIIQAAVWMEGSGPVQPPAPPKLDTGVKASFPVYAAAEDLAIRSQTLVAETTLIKRVPLNTQFTVLETDAAANAKLGQQNQWLAVKAADGVQGYVAAWYVSKTKTTATPPSTPPPPAAVGKIIVKTTTDGVALRSKPEIVDATILKRLPPAAELEVLEPLADVKNKIGVVYQWLKVKDIAGVSGVVAAWYVEAVTPLTALGAQDQRQTAMPSFDISELAEPLPALLRANTEGLALRSAPLISAQTLIKRLNKDSELIALDPPDIALQKLGQMGEWIHVRDIAGDEGYVAAWYTIERPADPEPSSSPQDC